nr:MAG TPA: periplasmic binding protein [Caudoviricetes sp.]
MEQNRLVFGLGAGFCYSCAPEGYTYQEYLPKVLSNIENHDILISTVDMPVKMAELIYKEIGTDRLYLDSGGFTLYKDEVKLGSTNPEFHKKCEKMAKKFLGLLKIIKPKQVFELDNEYFRKSDDLLSTDNYLRQEVYDILGFYPTPVFKMHQGFGYWKRLCECELYPTLSIGGLAQTKSWNTKTEEIKTMVDYARECGKKVHLLGCQNVEVFKTVQPDTVDYSIFQLGINLPKAKKENPTWNGMKEEYTKLRHHIVLWALAGAMVRSFLYNSYRKE